MNRIEPDPERFRASLPHDDPRHRAAHHFLNEEAALLDAAMWRTWLELLTPDITYLMPVRVTTMAGTDPSALGTHAHMDHFAEDLYSLSKRVERLMGGHAWTEDPPSRTRHLVTNVRAFPAVFTGSAGSHGSPGHSTAGDDYAVIDTGTEIEVESALLLFRSRGDDRPPEILSAGRRDRLRLTESGWRLARRTVTVDESVLRTQNLAILL